MDRVFAIGWQRHDEAAVARVIRRIVVIVLREAARAADRHVRIELLRSEADFNLLTGDALQRIGVNEFAALQCRVALREFAGECLRRNRRRLPRSSIIARDVGRRFAGALDEEIVSAGGVTAEAGDVNLRRAVFRESDVEARIVAAAAIVIIVLQERTWATNIKVRIECLGGERQRILLTLATVELKHVGDGIALIGLGFAGLQRAAHRLARLQSAAAQELPTRRQSGRHHHGRSCPNVHWDPPQERAQA